MSKKTELRHLIERARELLYGALAVIENAIVAGRIREFIKAPYTVSRDALFEARSVLMVAADENTVMRVPVDHFLSTTGVP
jgi:hypothetical protein